MNTCRCGCGEQTGSIRGKENQYLKGHHRRGVSPPKGENHHLWKGGHVDSRGYSRVLMPEHPRSGKSGYVLEHILTAEKALGKPLPEKAVVHHANGSRNSGTIVICQDRAYHNLLHQRTRSLRACGHASWRKCCFCKQYDEPANLIFSGQNKGKIYHKKCENEYQRDAHRIKKLQGA